MVKEKHHDHDTFENCTNSAVKQWDRSAVPVHGY